MILRQIEVGQMANFCYLVGCPRTRRALAIDPGAEAERIAAEAQRQGLRIAAIVNTHGHGDHTAAGPALKALTGAPIMMHALDAGALPGVDGHLADGQDLSVGDLLFKLIHTPGHSPGGICLYAAGQLFTGDTLFVGDSGRTDLPGGHRPYLAASIRRLMQLPAETVIWPGHDYGPTPSSTIGWEKRHNVKAREYGFFEEPP